MLETYRGVRGERNDVKIIEADVFRANHESVPARRVEQRDTLNLDVGGVVREE